MTRAGADMTAASLSRPHSPDRKILITTPRYADRSIPPTPLTSGPRSES
jgi:hypothetical protein